MRVLRAAFVYFAWVFAAGFVLGSIRMPLLVPALGVRPAELLELPFMLAIAAWIARLRSRRERDLSRRQHLAFGGLAMAMLLVAECGLGGLLGKSPAQVLFDRDPISGPAYYVALAVTACWPWWWARHSRSGASFAKQSD